MQPVTVKIMIDQKQPENVESFKYLGSMLTNDGRCTCEIKSIIVVAKAAFNKKVNAKGKAVPLQGWSDPWDSRNISFPDFMTMAQDSGKVVSPTHRPPLPPGNTLGTNFC